MAFIHVVAPVDLERERRFVAGLSAQTKRQRVLGAVGQASDAQLRRLVTPQIGKELALAYVLDDEFVAVARYALHQQEGALTERKAEFAIVVADAFQGQGIGKLLGASLIEHARDEQVTELTGECYADNQAVIALVRGLGFKVSAHSQDSTLCWLAISLEPRPTSPKVRPLGYSAETLSPRAPHRPPGPASLTK